MSNETFPVQKTFLSSAAIVEKLLNKYNWLQPKQCSFFQPGLNDTYLIKSESSNFYFRVYRYNWRSEKEVEAEVELLNDLALEGLPVSRPLKMSDDSYIHKINAPEGIRYAVLFTDAGGDFNSKEAQSLKYGNLAARIHNVTDSLPRSYDRFHIDLDCLVDRPIKAIAPYLSHRPDDFEYLKQIGEMLKEKINGLLSKDRPVYGICHGDLHYGNVHFDSEDQPTLYDFDCFGFGWRAYDIAVFLWNEELSRYRIGKEIPEQSSVGDNFLKGYVEERTLSSNEYEAIKVFVPIRDIWLMGLHTEGANNWGRSWINDKYFNRHISFIKEWIKAKKIR